MQQAGAGEAESMHLAAKFYVHRPPKVGEAQSFPKNANPKTCVCVLPCCVSLWGSLVPGSGAEGDVPNDGSGWGEQEGPTGAAGLPCPPPPPT